MSRARCGVAALGAVVALGAAAAGLVPAAGATVTAAASDHIVVSGVDIVSPRSGAFHVISRACSLTSTDDGARPVHCVLTASGTGGTGTFRVISSDGVTTGTLLLCGCGSLTGTVTERDFDGPAHAGTAAGSLTAPLTPTVNPRILHFAAAFTIYDAAPSQG